MFKWSVTTLLHAAFRIGLEKHGLPSVRATSVEVKRQAKLTSSVEGGLRNYGNEDQADAAGR
jgi:hypothetical protein